MGNNYTFIPNHAVSSGTRQQFATEFPIQHVSGLERALTGLSHRRNKTQLLQHGHQIVVGVETDDFPVLDLEHLTEPQFGIPARRWNISRGHMQWTGVSTPTSKLNDNLILCGKRIGNLCTAPRETICEKQQELLEAL